MRSSAVRISLYAAALAAGGSFGLLFEEGAALWMFGAAVVGAAAGSAGRYRFALLPPLAALYGVVAAYGPAALIPFGGWSGAISAAQRDVPGALGTMYLQPVPYEPAAGLLLLLSPLVVLLGGLAVSATLYEESPVLSLVMLGVALGVISTVSFEEGIVPYFAAFLLSGVLLLLASGGGFYGISLGGLAAGGAVAAAVLVLPQTPLASAAIQPSLVDWTNLGAGDTSRLATEADVGDYLDSGRDAKLMTVQSPEPLYWRGGTLDSFDGVRWSSTLEEGEPDGAEISPGIETQTVRQQVEIADARTNLVFGGYDIQDVSLPGAETRTDGSWSVDYQLQKGQSYEVLSEVPQPTEEQLASAGTDYPEEVEQRFFQLPSDRPDEVADTAGIIRRDYSTSNPYEKARAIQRYLLYDGNFTYNLDVDYRRADQAIEDFLGEGREGFCTQFATSMALIAREMGVPSRVVYGATSGEEIREDEYLVRGANMHTWVEIYFPGVGWYPFDPTPGRGLTGAMQENAPPPSSGGSYGGELQPGSPALNSESPVTAPSTPEGEEPPSTVAEGARKAGPEEEAGIPAYALAVPLCVALFGAAPLLRFALLRRGKPADYYRDMAGRLEDLPGNAEARGGASLTPSERLTTLARSAGLEEEPFARLARAYTEHLYSPRPASDVAAAYTTARSAYGRLPLWRRTLAAMNPASLSRRAAGAVSKLPRRLVRAVR